MDRTRSGNVRFHPKFSGVYSAPLAARQGPTRLHVFVDACSVEVFVNEGERVFTTLVFPSAGDRGVECFGPGGKAKLHGLEVWTLKSAWR